MEVQNQINANQHPKELYVLFFTEMWERFSYYGMRSLLILYLIQYLHYTEKFAGQLYGVYTGMVYLTPIIGGLVADRWIGHKKAVYLGGLLMAFGHLSIAFDSVETLYIGLGLLILGNGFFKPNISTILGDLYTMQPHLKDAGFTIFYMGINLGAFAGPILCGYLGEKLGWHYGFGAAGVGMILGLAQFHFFSKSGRLKAIHHSQIKETRKNNLSKPEKDRILAIIILAVFTIFFWLAFEQAGSSINLFTLRNIDRNISLGFLFSTESIEIPTSMFQAVNPLLILLLAPLVARFWSILSEQKKEPDTITKFALGFVFLGLGFGILAYGASLISVESPKVSMLWLLLGYLFHTIGELFLSPVGLSMVSKIAPEGYTALLMGLWFLSSAIAHYSGGMLSGYMSEFQNTRDFFSIFVFTSISASGILWLLRGRIRSLVKNG